MKLYRKTRSTVGGMEGHSVILESTLQQLTFAGDFKGFSLAQLEEAGWTDIKPDPLVRPTYLAKVATGHGKEHWLTDNEVLSAATLAGIDFIDREKDVKDTARAETDEVFAATVTPNYTMTIDEMRAALSALRS